MISYRNLRDYIYGPKNVHMQYKQVSKYQYAIDCMNK